MILYDDRIVAVDFNEDTKKWTVHIYSSDRKAVYNNAADRSMALFNVLADCRNSFDKAILAVIDNMAKERAKL